VKFKLDENVDTRLIPLVEEGGHGVDTVRDERLSGADDRTIYDACVRDGRILLTLDLDFSNPTRFPPGPTEGIIIVRPAIGGLFLIAKRLRHRRAETEQGSDGEANASKP
jgi:predicted nuclease of predicted toxin-antitoxin system